MQDLYTLCQELIHAGQMGLPLLRAERLFYEGLDAYGAGKREHAQQLLEQTSAILRWEISQKRRFYRSVIGNASSVAARAINEGTVCTWPIMTSESGDMEWNAAIKEVLIVPDGKWDPPQENMEKLVHVIHGRGATVVEGKTQRIFKGDTICLPPNIVSSFQTTGLNAPMHLLIWETWPDRKPWELKGEPGYEKFPERKSKQQVSEAEARSAIGSATSAIDMARNRFGITRIYEASPCYEIAQKCLHGGDFVRAYVLAQAVVDQVGRYVEDLERNRALLASQRIPVSNTMYLERQVFHAGTCPAWVLSADLPVEYTQALSVFEIEADVRLGPHTHNTEEFYYVLQGRALMMVADPIGTPHFQKDQTGVEVNPGDLIYIPPNSLHSIFPAGDGHRISCLALIGYTDEEPELNDISWERAYQDG